MPFLQRQRSKGTTSPGASTAGTVTRAFLNKSRFPFVLIGVFAVAAVTIWADRSIRGAVQAQLRGHLETILETEVEALKEWQKSQGAQARSVVGQPDVREAAIALKTAPDAARVKELTRAVSEAMAPLGYRDFLFVVQKGQSFLILAATQETWQSERIERGLLHDLLLRTFAEGAARISPPIPSVVPRPDAQGKLRVGIPHMGVAVPLRSSDREVAGVLVLGIDPAKDFTRILRLARFGESGETYTFDAQGMMLSQSRFDPELRRLGLLETEPGMTSILHVRIEDPGVDLTAGKVPSGSQDELPLTRSAKGAIAKEAGTHVGGYRDYRGVRVIGAWRWLDDLGMGMGIATEVDYAEAYAPLVQLRLAFGALVALLFVAGGGTLAFMFVAARSDVARRKAEHEAESMGQYQLEEKLGQGGMGTVYKAQHSLLRRPTAVKILDPGEDGAESIARFEREVQATARLVNPHTIRIYDYGHTADGKFFYAMEYLDGLTLGDLLEVHGGPLCPARAVHLLCQICESLAEAHAEGLVHRDVKPDNVLVCARGGRYDDIKVLDFGLVKDLDGGDSGDINLTRAGTVMGTPLYMPPEQVTGGQICPTADVYAVGGLAYHLLTGAPPFMGKSVVEILTMHVSDPPPPLAERRGEELPGGLEDLVLSCLAKQPEERPANAGALLERLRDTGLARTWTQSEARAWWMAQAEAIKDPPQQASKDMTGLSWLRTTGADQAPASITATVELPPPGDLPAVDPGGE